MALSAVLPSFDHIRFAHAGSVVYPPGGRYGPRIQQDLQLVLLHSGEMKVTVDGIIHGVKAGHAVLLRPGTHEMFVFAEKQETWHRWISVHGDEEAFCGLLECNEFPYVMPIPEEINRIVDLMLSLQSEHADDSAVVRSLGHAALQMFASGLGGGRQPQAHPSVQAAKQIVHQDYAKALSLQRIAAISGVSPEHLVRLFRMYEDTTPMKYVWSYRVLKAVELLSHTGLSISEVAERCGFQTTYHFARTVKKQTGSTPSELRRACWGEA